MEKQYSQIIGIPVVAEGVGQLARITDIIIDHKDGKVAAFFVNSGKMKIIAPIDIIFFGQSVIISDVLDIIDADDLLKASEVINDDIRILKSRVETKKGEYLGNIYDYYIDTKGFGLTKIVVYKSYLGLFKTPERVISARDIIEIKKNLVIVKNKCAKNYALNEEEKVPKFYPETI